MVEVGDRPLLWHIMKIYAAHGLTDFVICCGYRGYMIKEYFSNYSLHDADVTIDLRDGQAVVHHRVAEPWKVTLVDTGELTQTGGRLARIRLSSRATHASYGRCGQATREIRCAGS
jgi:glucose-1-phosphate cytidylyltransferase